MPGSEYPLTPIAIMTATATTTAIPTATARGRTGPRRFLHDAAMARLARCTGYLRRVCESECCRAITMIQRHRRSGSERRWFVWESLPERSARRSRRALEHRRPRLARARSARPSRRTNYQARLERSTGLGGDTLSDALSHDPPCYARGRWSRRPDTPRRWRVRGRDLGENARRRRGPPGEHS